MNKKMLFFKIKANISITINDVKVELEKKFPEFEYSFFGIVGKGLKVKKSMLTGSRVYLMKNVIFVKKTPPTLIGNLIDSTFFGLLSGRNNNKIAARLMGHLKEIYG